MNYRRIPHIIKAECYDAPYFQNLLKLSGSESWIRNNITNELTLHSIGLTIKPEEWLLKGTSNEFWVLSDEEFKRYYERIEID